MAKKKYYLVLDTETCTLPFAEELVHGDSELKKKIAIAKPLVYDIGWTICDRKGKIYDKKQFLIAETFSVPSIFNTAYYAEKRPIYIDMLSKGLTSIKPWDEAMETLINDMKKVDAVGAFNAMFDFKKAIPFTESYIRNLYSLNFAYWEKAQYDSCQRILDNNPIERDKEFDSENFEFRKEKYPLFDIWGLATKYLLNNQSYKKDCIMRGQITNSGVYFKTSAEVAYQYLNKKPDFIESHTALDDAEIETFILSKLEKVCGVKTGLTYFPFRDLGYTYEFCKRHKNPNLDECRAVYKALKKYCDMKLAECEKTGQAPTNYVNQLQKKMEEIVKYVRGE